MAAGGAHGLKWSADTYNIRDVIRSKKFGLPLLVKIEEGIYNLNESETFSQDDLLKLDLVKSIPKVITCCVDHLGRTVNRGVVREDEHGYIEQSDDLTIPLRYKGMVRIFQPQYGKKEYHSVREMVKVFPRYVKTLNSFVSKNGISVERETVIELDRILPGEGLVCNIVDDDNSEITNIVLGTNDKHMFSLIPDDTEYTLEAVTNRFPLPQYVRFVDGGGPKLLTANIQEIVEHSKIFEGTVKIKNVVNMEVLIGHYKPPEEVSRVTKGHCQRTLVMFPLDSPIAREIEVRVPPDSDDDDDDRMDYELVMAKNFSQKGLNEEEVDGTVYIDFLKVPKATFVEYEEIDTPPPLPFRKKGSTRNKPPPSPTKMTSSKSEYDYSNLDRLPTRTVPTATSSRVPLPPDSDESDDDYDQIDEKMSALTDDDKENGYIRVQSKEAILEKVPEKYKFSLKKVQEELLKFVKKKRKESESTEPSKHTTQKTYDERKLSKQSCSVESTEPGKHRTQKTNIQQKLSKHSFSDTDKYQTADESQSKSDSRKWFESLKPNDLYKYLTEIQLDKIAIACRDNNLNGTFFNNLTDAKIMENFHISPIQILKFRRFQNDGWLPN
ncbi:uncharacterized protein LOC117326015 isoform X2 [Pecten maximus]|uniref:uncharacterized protein LOC117326015 isoform X2 n=1 Tax=Pecten maximus TaxID=6579 RepID=UPI00145853F3|nr:uncharacterized protein LOC117326015 isoform X2 [Pecten maximus]